MPIPEKLVLISQQLDLTAGRISTCIDDLAEDEFYRSPEKNNHMLWLLGHAANSRLGLVILLGGQAERPWNELFSKGSQPGDRSSLPSVTEVRASWKSAIPALNTHIEQLTDDDLAQPCARDFPIPDKSRLGAASFLSAHEMYHLGQMSALRKWLGQGQLVG